MCGREGQCGSTLQLVNDCQRIFTDKSLYLKVNEMAEPAWFGGGSWRNFTGQTKATTHGVIIELG